MEWNPEQYLKFEAPRLQPAIDLLRRIDHPGPGHVVDLGCGTGAMTRALAERWPQARVVGIDGSPEMLRKAAADAPGLGWQQADLADWQPDGPVDVIYSNAALHWLPDHARLFPRLAQTLAPGGVLAAQMPCNFGEPSHTMIDETVRGGPWRDRLEPLLRPVPVHEPTAYYDWLRPLLQTVDLREIVYYHVLTGADPVKEWTKGTWLGSLLTHLGLDERAAFEADYAARLRRHYPPRADGSTWFPFHRLFVVGRR